MRRYDTLALDVGKVRIGVAAGNSEDKLVSSLETLERAQNRGIKKILQLIDDFQIKTVVVGLPLSENKQVTTQSKDVEAFVERLRKRTNSTIVLEDEWGSSEKAKHRLQIADSPDRKTRKSGVIDAESASIILESYFSQK